MLLKGIVSSIEASGTRVTFPDKDDVVSGSLPSASSVGLLSVGNNVIVAFFSSNLQDGVILAKF